MKRILLLGALALVAITCASGQEFRGAISGVVTDATAKVTVTENNTATKVETKSDASGHYNVPFLLPGDYDVAVHVDGFKEFLRKGLHLGACETPTIDVKLEVGTTQQTVEITDAVPMLNTENASIGQTITNKEIEDHPLIDTSLSGTTLCRAAVSNAVCKPCSSPSETKRAPLSLSYAFRWGNDSRTGRSSSARLRQSIARPVRRARPEWNRASATITSLSTDRTRRPDPIGETSSRIHTLAA
jgi:hypothetical protein